jgi:hypothetical protein
MKKSQLEQRPETHRSLLDALKNWRLPMALTKKEAARELSIGLTVLDQLIASGHILAIHYEDGSRPRITASELVRFLDERLKIAEAIRDEVKPRPKPARVPRRRKEKSPDVAVRADRLERLLRKR